jgi:hypothetical protein
MIQKKVSTLHSTYILQQILEMNGGKLQRCFVCNLVNTFWSISNSDHILSASLQFNYGITLVHTKFIFLPHIFHQKNVYTKSGIHCLTLTDFTYIPEMVKWWLEKEGLANTDYFSIVGDATELHLLLHKGWVLKLSSRQYKVKSL